MTLGRSTARQSRSASAMLPRVSRASPGETSIETKPSPPLVWSYTGRKRSAALLTSSTATASKISASVRPEVARRARASS